MKVYLGDQLPDSFFEVLGSWEDERDPDEIVAAIRARRKEPEAGTIAKARRLANFLISLSVHVALRGALTGPVGDV